MVVAGTSGLPGGFMLAQNNSPAPTFLPTSNNSVDGNIYRHNSRTGNKNTSSSVFHNTYNEHNAIRGATTNTNNNNLYDGSSGTGSNYVYGDNPVNTNNNSNIINTNTAGPLQIKAEYYSI